MSAKRFGGKFSPGAAGAADPAPTAPAAKAPPNKFRGRKASAVDARTVILFILPTPLLLAALSAVGSGAAVHMALLLIAYGCLMLGAWLVREGQRAHAEYDLREIARPPAMPRKIVAAALAGIGVFLASWIGAQPTGLAQMGGQYVTSTIFGLAAIGAHLLAFGIDPLRAKGLDSVAAISAAEVERVMAAVDKAEARLAVIEALADKVDDREISDRVHALNQTVRQMIAMVERDPRDLSRARRYLGVYLSGAEDAMRKYAEQHEHYAGDGEIREQFLAMWTDLEASFARGRETLLIDDRTDLEVEIEVLRERLDQESVHRPGPVPGSHR